MGRRVDRGRRMIDEDYYSRSSVVRRLYPTEGIASEDHAGLEQRAIALLLVLLFMAATGAGALAALLLKSWTPNLHMSLFGSSPKGYWYLSRTSGVVAYALVWYSMALGLLITNKLARIWPGGFSAFDLHQYVSLLGLGFSIFHMLVLLGDPKIHLNLIPLLIPFGGISYRSLWIAAGQIGLYVMAIVTLSFYVRQRIGKRAWKLIHYASFLLFAFVLLHGVFAGPDSNEMWAQGMYWFTGSSIVCLTVYRVWVTNMRAVKRNAQKLSAVSRQLSDS